MQSFNLGDKKMVYDRGRYKQSENAGSRSEKKGSGFLQSAPAPVREKAEREIAVRQGQRKEEVGEMKKNLDLKKGLYARR